MKSLVDTKSKAANSLTNVIAAKTEYDNQVNYRKQLFDQLSPLASRVMRILEASGATHEKLADARANVQRINGSAYKGKVVPAEPLAVVAPTGTEMDPAKKTRSQQQKSYASKADAFAKLVSSVSTEPLYLSNEEALSIEGFKKQLDVLNAANMNVSVARVAWSNACIDRNSLLYRQDQTMYRTGLAVKKYVRAIYGLNSEQYAQVKNVVFTKPS